LTHFQLSGILRVVTKKTVRLARLLADVRELASRTGAKSELAKFIGVSPSRVSEWLSPAGEYWKPRGEVALAMKEWVILEKAKQQKRPGRGSTRPERKIQRRKSTT
jgi:hypothetical protein